MRCGKSVGARLICKIVVIQGYLSIASCNLGLGSWRRIVGNCACVYLRSLQLVPSVLVAVSADPACGGGPHQRKTRLRWHHRMKTYTDQTRDQYMPGARRGRPARAAPPLRGRARLER